MLIEGGNGFVDGHNLVLAAGPIIRVIIPLCIEFLDLAALLFHLSEVLQVVVPFAVMVVQLQQVKGVMVAEGDVFFEFHRISFPRWTKKGSLPPLQFTIAWWCKVHGN